MTTRNSAFAFTLIELLVSISILGLLIAILLPFLSSARRHTKSTLCQSRLRTFGQGLVLYANDNREALIPGRMPRIDDEQWQVYIEGGLKYRPTFLAMMASEVGLAPFSDPMPTKNDLDVFLQPGDRQNYDNEAYICPSVRFWVDERNGCYGYNYQFLGNARLRNPDVIGSYKNWRVKYSRIQSPAGCVAVADSLGTAASFPKLGRKPYEDNDPGDSESGRTVSARGNEGFNLDPPNVDPENGEMAAMSDLARSAIDERHGGRGNVLWVDGHVSPETLASLGYKVEEDSESDEVGVVRFDGDNRFFTINRKSGPWIQN